MLRWFHVLVLAAAAGSCASRPPLNEAAVSDAIRFGIAACERHYLTDEPIEVSIAALANGRRFDAGRAFEDWTQEGTPWKLGGQDVWVGIDESWDACELMAVGGGNALRDAVIAERLQSKDRKWFARPGGASGAKAVCTTDNIPENKTLRVMVRVDRNMQLYDRRFYATITRKRECGYGSY